MSAKDRRMMKILQEELGDPDKILSANKSYRAKKAGRA